MEKVRHQKRFCMNFLCFFKLILSMMTWAHPNHYNLCLSKKIAWARPTGFVVVLWTPIQETYVGFPLHISHSMGCECCKGSVLWWLAGKRIMYWLLEKLVLITSYIAVRRESWWLQLCLETKNGGIVPTNGHAEGKYTCPKEEKQK